MRQDYKQWLIDKQYSANTRITQMHRVRKVEEAYGNLDEHFANGTYQDVLNALLYTADDEKANKPNPSKIKFHGNVRNNLQSYKYAAARYVSFLIKNKI